MSKAVSAMAILSIRSTTKPQDLRGSVYNNANTSCHERLRLAKYTSARWIHTALESPLNITGFRHKPILCVIYSLLD